MSDEPRWWGELKASGATPSEDTATRVLTQKPGEPKPVSGSRPGGAPGETSAFRPGTVLNNTHRIEALIARGGMGEVYRAVNLVTHDQVAIKTIRGDHSGDPMILELFRREAMALRRVSHPAVVKYEGVLIDSGGTLYLVMEYVEGPSLSEHIKSEHIRPPAVRRLRDRLAAGLAAAHAEKVIHRDLSPDNVILPGGRLDEAKLIDFGIARQIDLASRRPGETAARTVIGREFAGKYQFAAPEQLAGRPADERTDVYGLGLVLAAAAIGQPLDMGSTMMAAVEARRGAPDLSAAPAETRRWLARMLNPDPARRPRSMDEVIRLDRPSHGKRWLAVAAALGALGIAGAGTAAWLAGNLQIPWVASSERERLAWEAVDKGSPAALRAYLAQNPDGRHAEEARARLAAIADVERRRLEEQKAWESADRDDAAALRAFLDRHPDGTNAPSARARLAELEAAERARAADRRAWDAVNKDDAAALRGFIERNPDSAYLGAAQRRLGELAASERQRADEQRAWDQANKNDAAALRAFLDRHPSGRNAGQARQRLAEIEQSQRAAAEARQAWDATDKTDPRALRAFLDRHPASPQADDARRRLNDLAALDRQRADERRTWEQTDRNDAAALRAFLDRYPAGAFAEEARRRGAELAAADRARTEAQRAWDATNRNDPAALRAYLDRHPDSPAAAAARDRLAELAALDRQRADELRLRGEEQRAWEQANKNDPASLRAFLDRHPGGLNAPAARQRIERLEAEQREWPAAQRGTAAQLREFMRRHPDGRYAQDARNRLAQLEQQAWDQVRDSTDPAALQRFLAEWPGGRYAAAARQRLAAAAQPKGPADTSPLQPVAGTFTGVWSAQVVCDPGDASGAVYPDGQAFHETVDPSLSGDGFTIHYRNGSGGTASFAGAQQADGSMRMRVSATRDGRALPVSGWSAQLSGGTLNANGSIGTQFCRLRMVRR